MPDKAQSSAADEPEIWTDVPDDAPSYNESYKWEPVTAAEQEQDEMWQQTRDEAYAAQSSAACRVDDGWCWEHASDKCPAAVESAKRTDAWLAVQADRAALIAALDRREPRDGE